MYANNVRLYEPPSLLCKPKRGQGLHLYVVSKHNGPCFRLRVDVNFQPLCPMSLPAVCMRRYTRVLKCTILTQQQLAFRASNLSNYRQALGLKTGGAHLFGLRAPLFVLGRSPVPTRKKCMLLDGAPPKVLQQDGERTERSH